MGQERDLYNRWKRAKQQLNEFFQAPEHVVVIHYSCESFYDRDNPRSPRVTSIAIRNLDSGQTKSFSIHLVAERRRVLDSIDEHYDSLELEMLEEFFQAVGARQHCKWLHWNMRDANYGFEALENRFKVLGGQSTARVPEERRMDLSRILIAIYGVGYTSHPRIESLMQQNSITAMDFLTGQQEAGAFENKQFLKLHQSTLRKVDIFANFAERAHAGRLKTQSSWWEINGRSVKAVGELLREHWLIGSIVVIVGLITAIVKAWPTLAAAIN
ncbi:hypothetical protein [Undibacterium curvum]|uniref:hypothetical protein n=1 Tax=Undibacterium curvum TaxID=2762294 RepID=UPI003D0BBA9D